MNEKGEWVKEQERHPRRKQVVMTPEEVYDELLRLGFTKEQATRVKLAVGRVGTPLRPVGGNYP